MSHRNVKLLLFLAILIVGILPLLAALYFLDRSVQTSLALGFNPQIAAALEDSSKNLLALRRLDPQRQSEYRAQFETIEELRHVHANPDLIRSSIFESLRIYFSVGLVASVALSVFVAGWLSRRIAHAYTQTFNELIVQRDKVRYLQEMASWQQLAKMLAHEIKNPLTPIEVLVSSLCKAHARMSAEEFRQHLVQTQAMIGDELQHLQQTVNKFADFARLPEVQLVPTNIEQTLSAQLRAIATMFATARIDLHVATRVPLIVDVDTTLFRQVLVNIVRNGVEANPGREVRFDVRVEASDDAVSIRVANDGTPVPGELVPRMFDPYISSKSGKDNMGLGLAIVKKIVIDHRGDIRYECSVGRPQFLISLPRRTS